MCPGKKFINESTNLRFQDTIPANITQQVPSATWMYHHVIERFVSDRETIRDLNTHYRKNYYRLPQVSYVIPRHLPRKCPIAGPCEKSAIKRDGQYGTWLALESIEHCPFSKLSPSSHVSQAHASGKCSAEGSCRPAEGTSATTRRVVQAA